MKVKDRTINIFGTKYRVKFVDKVKDKTYTPEENVHTYGLTNSANQTIQVALYNIDGKPVSNDELERTLWHELIHAILDTGQYRASSADEPMVEWLARCIKSLIDQKIIQD